MERDLDAIALWVLGFVTVLLIGWVGFVLTARSWSHARHDLQHACAVGQVGLSPLQDSLFLAAAPECRR